MHQFAQSGNVVTFQNHEYSIIQSDGISFEAASAAVPTGWHLATVTTAEEQAFLAGLLTNMPHVTRQPDHYFIGATCIEGIWQWSNGEAWSYTNWGPGEPNSSSETICTMRESWFGDAQYNWKWNNVMTGTAQSSYFAGYIIEKDNKPSLVVYTQDKGDGIYSRIDLQVKNEGTEAIADAKVYYYFTAEKSVNVVLEDFHTPSCSISLVNLSNGNYAIVFDYKGYTFEKGKNEYLGLANIGIHYADYSAYNRADDYSFIDVTELTKNTSVVAKNNAGTIVFGNEPTLKVFPIIKAESFAVYPNPAKASDIVKIKYTLPQGISDGNVKLLVYKDWGVQSIDISGKNDQEISIAELNRWSCGSGLIYNVIITVDDVNAGNAKLIFNY